MLKGFCISVFLISIFSLAFDVVAENYGESGQRFLTELSDADSDADLDRGNKGTGTL